MTEISPPDPNQNHSLPNHEYRHQPTKTQLGWRIFFDSLKTILILGLLALFFRYFLLQPYLIDGPSMEPNFYDNDYLLVEKLTTKFTGFHRGDAIIFKYPKNPKLVFIKRIIGLPGEKIELTKGKVKVINSKNPQGKIITESYLPANIDTQSEASTIYQINEKEYFVMGDNRENSLDSRSWGLLPENLIIGKAWFRALPTSNIGLIKHPQYNLSFDKLLSPILAAHGHESKKWVN